MLVTPGLSRVVLGMLEMLEIKHTPYGYLRRKKKKINLVAVTYQPHTTFLCHFVRNDRLR